MTWALPIAGSIVGGLISKSGSDKQASAISKSGDAQAVAAQYAADQQYKAFQEQQANQNLKYGLTRADLSSLFGGNVNQNLTGANAGTGITTGGKTYEQLRAELLPQFTSQTAAQNPYLQYYSDGSPQANSAANFWDLTHPKGNIIDEAGLEKAIQAQLASQGGTSATGNVPTGTLFGPNTGVNDPRLQEILAKLQGQGTAFNQTATDQLNLFKSFNPQTMAQSIYDKLALLGQPQRAQDRANLESRLLNQGILTASPGYSQINSLDQAEGQTDLARQIQAMLTAQAQQQQYLQNATGLAGAGANLASIGGNLQQQALAPALQAAGISAGVPINSAQPIPTGELSVQGAQAAGNANVAAANITNSFWSSLGQNQEFQSGINSLFSGLTNLGNAGLAQTGGMPINTNPNLYGAEGLFSQLNGYGGGV
jgi:hypothetical protein